MGTGIDVVQAQIEMMPALEVGTLELVSLDDGALQGALHAGVNEDCPECVPTTDQVRQFVTASLGIHAPHVTEIEVEEA